MGDLAEKIFLKGGRSTRVDSHQEGSEYRHISRSTVNPKDARQHEPTGDLRTRILQIRKRSLQPKEELHPVFWTKQDRMFHDKGVVSYAILDTGGCRWATESGGCSMCGYVNDTCNRPVTKDEIIQQTDYIMGKIPCSNGPFALRIFTSGSFFDEREIGPESREYVLNKLRQIKGLTELTVESRPEHVTRELVSLLVDGLPGVEVEVAIGLESSSDLVRNSCIGKGFTFENFKRACDTIRSVGVRVKTYVLLKPPFLSEFDSSYDAEKTVEDVISLTDSVSVNACNIQKGTLVEELHRQGSYRPPWIWTVIEVLRKAHATAGEGTNIICDTVAFGTVRGPHNCRRCDKKATAMVRSFSLTQDPACLEGLNCPCEGEWAKIYNYHY